MRRDEPVRGTQPERLQIPSPHVADLALRDRVLEGDRSSAEELFQGHLEALYEFAYYRVGRDHAAAEDVVQEAFTIAFEKLADFDGRSSLYTWMCGIAKNRIRTRRRKRAPVRMEDLLADADPDIEAVLARIESEPLPDAALEAAETRELVGATLSSLPPDYRAALLEKYVDGRSAPEMARTQGRGVKAVESTLHRARTAFARVFTLLAAKRGGAA